MASIEWCLKKIFGIRIVEPSENVSDSYLDMADESIKALNNLKSSRIWSATT